MARSILLVIPMPEKNDLGATKAWQGILANLRDTASTYKDCQLLGENVLLIPLHKDLRTLGAALHAVGKAAYTFALLDGDIEWRQVPIQGQVHKA